MQLRLERNDYTVNDKIGGEIYTGNFSTIFAAQSQNKTFALKMINLAAVLHQQAAQSEKSVAAIYQQFDNERKITRHLTASHCQGHVPLQDEGYGRICYPTGHPQAKNNNKEKRLCLIYNRAISDARVWRQQHQHDLTAVLQFLSQTAWCLAEIHQANVIHRDIKLENILILNATNLELKITDFGTALMNADTTEQLNATSLVGSPSNQAPEYKKSKDNLAAYDNSVDIYGLATCIQQWFGIHNRQSLTANSPVVVSAAEQHKLNRAIASLQHHSDHTKAAKAKLGQLLLAMLAEDTTQRPTAFTAYLQINDLLTEIGESPFNPNSKKTNHDLGRPQQRQATIKPTGMLMTTALKTIVAITLFTGLISAGTHRWGHSDNSSLPVNMLALDHHSLSIDHVCHKGYMAAPAIKKDLIANCLKIDRLAAVIDAAKQANQRNPAIMASKINGFQHQQQQLHDKNLGLIQLVKQQNQLNHKINSTITKME